MSSSFPLAGPERSIIYCCSRIIPGGPKLFLAPYLVEDTWTGMGSDFWLDDQLAGFSLQLSKTSQSKSPQCPHQHENTLDSYK